MRTIECVNPFLDGNGKPLNGRLLVLEGTQPCTIYGASGNVLSNPVEVVNGFTFSQVFVADEQDCILQLEKQVGGVWVPFRTYISNHLEQTITLVGDALVAIPNNDVLRATDPESVAEIGGVKFVQKMGYNSAGDSPVIIYKWDETDANPDDGCTVVSSTIEDVGRWVAVGQSAFSLASFGCFPRVSVDEITANDRLNFKKACEANTRGFRIYVDNNGVNETALYYGVCTTSATLKNLIVGSSVVRLHGTGSNRITLIDCDEIPFYGDCYVTIERDVVHTSFVANHTNPNNNHVNLKPRTTIIFDSDYLGLIWNSRAIKALNVRVETKLTGYLYFHDCNIMAIDGAFLGYIHFYNCVYDPRWMDADAEPPYFRDCTTNRTYWSSTREWIEWVASQSVDRVVDCNWLVLDGFFALYSNTTLSNLVDSSYFVQIGNNIILTLENCTLNKDGYGVYSYGNGKVICKNTTATIYGTNIEAENSDVTLVKDLETLKAVNTTVTFNKANPKIHYAECVNTKFISDDAIVIENRTNNRIVFNGCSFAQDVELLAYGQIPEKINVEFINCCFNGHKLRINEDYNAIEHLHVIGCDCTEIENVNETQTASGYYFSGNKYIKDSYSPEEAVARFNEDEDVSEWESRGHQIALGTISSLDLPYAELTQYETAQHQQRFRVVVHNLTSLYFVGNIGEKTNTDEIKKTYLTLYGRVSFVVNGVQISAPVNLESGSFAYTVTNKNTQLNFVFNSVAILGASVTDVTQVNLCFSVEHERIQNFALT